MSVVPSFANKHPGLLRILIPSYYIFWVHCLSVVHVRFSDAGEIWLLYIVELQNEHVKSGSNNLSCREFVSVCVCVCRARVRESERL